MGYVILREYQNLISEDSDQVAYEKIVTNSVVIFLY